MSDGLRRPVTHLHFLGGSNEGDSLLEPGSSIALSEGMTIGSSGTSIVVANASPSPTHARIASSERGFLIRSAAIGAPVLLDGVAVDPSVFTPLEEGFVVRLGDASFIASSSAASAHRAPPPGPAHGVRIRAAHLREPHPNMRDRLAAALSRTAAKTVHVAVEAFSDDPRPVARSALQAIAAAAPETLGDVSLGSFDLQLTELDAELRWLVRRFPRFTGGSFIRAPTAPKVIVLEVDGWRGRVAGEELAVTGDLWFSRDGSTACAPDVLPEDEGAPSQFGFRKRSHGRWALSTPSSGKFEINEVPVPDPFVLLAAGDIVRTAGLKFRFET